MNPAEKKHRHQQAYIETNKKFWMVAENLKELDMPTGVAPDRKVDIENIQDAVAAWSFYNFGDQPAHRPLLGAVEELGELSHAFLKDEQGIRDNEDHLADMKDAVGDVVIYLADFCNRVGISMSGAISEAWLEVKDRDWKNKPTAGKEISENSENIENSES